MSYAKVYINSSAYALDRIFDYEIPDGMKVFPRVRVEVPFAGRKVDGFVDDVSETTEVLPENIKEIISVLDDAPICSELETELAEWIRNRYFSTHYSALRLFMPPGSNIKFKEAVTLINSENAVKLTENSVIQTAVLEFLMQNGGVSTVSELNHQIGKNVRQAVSAMIKKGIVAVSKKRFSPTSEKTENVAYITADYDVLEVYMAENASKAPAQMRILAILEAEGEMSVPELLDSADAGKGSLDTLCKKGIADVYKRPISRIDNELFEADVPPKLTDEQQTVLDELWGKKGRYLLRGVTGSGKTEVYLRIIGDTIESGKNAIMLVPEISLTPQTIRRFGARFGDMVAVLHSGLSIGERYDNWQRIKRGEVRVVVGARSAVFAPLDNIGVIIIDEQHDDSYVSEVSPRYDAREVAFMRARQYGALLLEASATPRISDVYFCKNRLSMSKRYNSAPLPSVEIADMRIELEEGNTSVFSRKLASEISKNLENGEQTVLFINRRGHSSFISCRKCGYVFDCPNCSVSLKYHSKINKLICHYCGYRTTPKDVCPQCGSSYVKYFGTGTQRVEDEINRLFPEASVVRMDIDTTAKKSSHKKLLQRFSDEKADILLGTQMIAKGLDFPGVTLVGVLAADTMLNSGEYDSEEKAFSLLTQVLGRAGRGDRRGRAVIQTYSPENDCIEFAKMQDYNGFYKQEIALRKLSVYPPFCRIFTVIVSGSDNSSVGIRINEIKSELTGTQGIIEIMKPVPCLVSKVNNVFRWQMLIKASADIRPALWAVYDRHHSKKRDTYVSVF